ncbi:hypothetical protein J4G37_15740 [Microvirga sp. 3-52]|nr:hypothetical protein [Microvirga sp. 3-52]
MTRSPPEGWIKVVHHITPTVDRVEVRVLVDNVTDSLSTVPSYVENEWSYLRWNGMTRLSGRCTCCAAHGLSCLITAHRGERRHTILFDTGPESPSATSATCSSRMNA